MSKKVKPGDLIQVNEDGPYHWFRVIDEVRSWGVQAYVTLPGGRHKPAGDAFMRLEWQEFDVIGAQSLFVAQPINQGEADDKVLKSENG